MAALAIGCGDNETAAPSAVPAAATNVTSVLDFALQTHAEGHLEQAALEYQRVLDLDQDNKFAFYNLGLIDQTSGRSVAAALKYRKVLELDTSYVPALYNLAVIRTAEEAFDEAISLYRRSIAATPGNPSAHHNLGLLLKRTGATAEGDAELARAAEIAGQVTPPAPGTATLTTAKP